MGIEKTIIMATLTMVGIMCLIFWHIKIDSETTWLYGIYEGLILIGFLAFLISLE